MNTLNATQLAPLLNSYTINPGPPRTIVVPHASKLAALRDVTVLGTLLPKQVLLLKMGAPQIPRPPATQVGNGGYHKAEADGDLHFCLGVKPLQPHIPCEIQHATNWLTVFNQLIGQQIRVSGFFRCLFEHPGFNPKNDAHIFEIHPVRAFQQGNALHQIDVVKPDVIHPWSARLNQQDAAVKVQYDKAKDRLTFSNVGMLDTNYVQLAGKVSNLKLSSGAGVPSSFTFSSPQIGHAVAVYCLQDTTAATELRKLKKQTITLVALRNIDLAQTIKTVNYVISLVAIDIQ